MSISTMARSPKYCRSAWLLILSFLVVSSSSSSVCLTEEEIKCLLSDDAEDPTVVDDQHLPTCGNDQLHQQPIQREGIVLGRLRFPGTASTHQYDQFRQYESDDVPRFTGIATNARQKCSTNNLCFENAEGETAQEAEYTYSLAVQQIHLTGFGSHLSYDSVASTLQHVADQRQQKEGSDQPGEYYMITTLRELGSYAFKWYSFRRIWDAVKPELVDLTFEEWIDEAPWRHNVLTRMLGSNDDRLAMPKNLLYTKVESLGAATIGNSDYLDTFLKDEYMQRQNELGPEESEVYATALERLENMVHFGLFHRLSETWKLMEHTFCWTMGYQNYRPDKEITGYDALKMKLYPGMAAEDIDEIEATRIWNKLKDRNRLDLALMKEAERIFDERLEQMKLEKEDGILCNFLRKVEVRCEDDGGDAFA